MTKSDWLTVAMVAAVIMSAIATLLGPVLAVYIQSRISKHRPRPLIEQPGNAFQRFWAFLDLGQMWPAFALMVTGAIVCRVGLGRANQPVSRWSVLTIAVGTAIYVCGVIGFAMYKNFDALWVAIDNIKDSSKERSKRKR
jgi:hypothetical protein